MAAPRSTYRLQLHPGFGFADAAAIVDYLADLGVSHVYCSPYLQAAPGSTHGYDVVDHSRVNEELGGTNGHAAFSARLGEVGLGQVLDIVPNHMAVTGENRWWWDVLENGPASLYASYFDVDWDPPEAKLRNTVSMPILGDHYGTVLEAGDIRVLRDGASFTVGYFDHVLPVAPRSLDEVLMPAGVRAGSDDLQSIAAAFGNLPLATATDRESVRARHRDKEVLRRQLDRLLTEQPRLAAEVDTELARLNADVDALDAFLDRQNYRLAFWRTAGRELGYRRFFDINTLVGLRMEDPVVFEDTHRLVLGWLGLGVLDGLRIDHPDGLRDPEQYVRRLAERAGDAWIVLEKIVEPGEHLPPTWPVAGTTGYDFLNEVGGLFVDPAGEQPLTDAYGELTGEPTDWAELVHEKKSYVLREVLGADVNRLSNLLVNVAERHRRYRDFTRHELHEAMREVLADLPVYRTYVVDAPSESDRAYVTGAIDAARARRSDLDTALFDFLAALLLAQVRGALEDEFRARFQQLSGPATAKGVEDTAFYDFNRFVCLNEVGGDPGRFGVSVDEFHSWCGRVATTWPLTMTTLSTHDTKRSEDVRARLALLSEIPDRWAGAARDWLARSDASGVDRNARYLLFQVLVGAWPLTEARAGAYLEKATKEAKQHTSWVDPNPEYDEAVQRFVADVFADRSLLADVEAFVEPLVLPGWVNSLSQKLVELTAVGVPDTYQGTELWDLSLVDPDNRRPVDYGVRRRLLTELAGDGLDGEAIWKRADEGLPKLHVVRTALHLRNRRPDAFRAPYEPIDAGPWAVAYRRGDVVVAVPRLVLSRPDGLAAPAVDLPGGRWTNLLEGLPVSLWDLQP